MRYTTCHYTIIDCDYLAKLILRYQVAECSFGVADPEERVTTGQLLLQSFYEDQDRAMRLGGLHHTSLSGVLTTFCCQVFRKALVVNDVILSLFSLRQFEGARQGWHCFSRHSWKTCTVCNREFCWFCLGELVLLNILACI